MNLIEQQDTAANALKNRPVVLRNRRQRKKTSDSIVNLPFFFYNFSKDHSIPNLIWNHKVNLVLFTTFLPFSGVYQKCSNIVSLQTREELRICLENELRQFINDRDLAGNLIVAWNYQEFEVTYQVSI